ncbi:hypothetical protein [Candidatus Tisiphia endosymbiont of Oplodontha viridula]|uniref:hypothetical protein n=1 Tax=Candidatus Tisiphia endosymbiont of Oplodontha viridula TaxID=3077925 RepID=UPI0035C88656
MTTNVKDQQNNLTNEKINNITNIAAQILGEVLQSNNITYIELVEVPIGLEGMEILGKVLEDNKLITTIHLCNNDIDLDGLSLLITLLEKNHSLINIDIEYNNIGVQGLIILGSVKFSRCLVPGSGG